LYIRDFKRNVAIELLALLLHALEVPGFISGPEVFILTGDFCGFSQPFQANAKILL
jgi:hypothetical protein